MGEMSQTQNSVKARR